MEINRTDTVSITGVNAVRENNSDNAAGAQNAQAQAAPQKAQSAGPAYQVTLSAEAQQVSEAPPPEAAPPADQAATYNNMGEITG